MPLYIYFKYDFASFKVTHCPRIFAITYEIYKKKVTLYIMPHYQKDFPMGSKISIDAADRKILGLSGRSSSN